jgi:hypothetical protein
MDLNRREFLASATMQAITPKGKLMNVLKSAVGEGDGAKTIEDNVSDASAFDGEDEDDEGSDEFLPAELAVFVTDEMRQLVSWALETPGQNSSNANERKRVIKWKQLMLRKLFEYADDDVPYVQRALQTSGALSLIRGTHPQYATDELLRTGWERMAKRSTRMMTDIKKQVIAEIMGAVLHHKEKNR